MNYNQSFSHGYKTSELIRDLENKNSEILKLNFKIQELEKIRNEMLIDLERYENEFQLAEKKSTMKENELMDKIEISELEKHNLKKRLDYYQQMYPSMNSNFNNFNEVNNHDKLMKEEMNIRNEKIDMLLNFYNNMQNIVLNKNTNANVLHNLDTFALKYRFNEILDALKNSTKLKSENHIKDPNINGTANTDNLINKGIEKVKINNEDVMHR